MTAACALSASIRTARRRVDSSASIFATNRGAAKGTPSSNTNYQIRNVDLFGIGVCRKLLSDRLTSSTTIQLILASSTIHPAITLDCVARRIYEN